MGGLEKSVYIPAGGGVRALAVQRACSLCTCWYSTAYAVVLRAHTAAHAAVETPHKIERSNIASGKATTL